MKAEKIRFGYGIFLSVFTAVLGVLFITFALIILGEGNWAQGAYSRDIVVQRLFPVSIVFYVWVAAVIAGFALSLVYPFKEKPVKIPQEGATLRKLYKRIPEGEGAEYDGEMKRVRDERRNRLIVYIVCAAICFGCAVASAIYLLQPKNFNGLGTNDAMFKMMCWVLPCVVVGLLSCVGMTVYEKYSQKREISAIKRLMASYKNNPVIKVNVQPNAVLAAISKFFSNKYTLICIRAGIAVIAVTFIILGIFNEGAQDVLIKAIKICTECIGLG